MFHFCFIFNSKFQPLVMYDRTRHLDLTGALENIAFVNDHLHEGGNSIPDEWRVSFHFT